MSMNCDRKENAQGPEHLPSMSDGPVLVFLKRIRRVSMVLAHGLLVVEVKLGSGVVGRLSQSGRQSNSKGDNAERGAPNVPVLSS